MSKDNIVSCKVSDLGRIDYQAAYHIQRDTVDRVIAGYASTLLLCEHEPVFTLGRVSTEKNILTSIEQIKKYGAVIIRIDRGGEVTFHGHGQLVIYPIFQLTHFGKDLKLYMGKLEQVAIDLLQHFGIVANRIFGQRGVWVDKKKVASIGIGVRKWVSYHGMAINVNTDLRFFSMIKPCGLNVQMTSIAQIKNQETNFKEVKQKTIECFAKNFHLNIIKE